MSVTVFELNTAVSFKLVNGCFGFRPTTKF